ncbi:MAG: acyl-CoA dehydrogenase family protein [Actinomycetota bacterium]|nr:acyl-CoA dehydrogenase family protein [Actinomycetota bacterium]
MTNQPGPLEPYNLFTSDPVLGEAFAREGSSDAGLLTAFGERAGSDEVFEWGHQANRFPPELATHDRFGDRLDEVTYHPSYHSLMDLSVTNGIHSMRYEGEPGDGGYVTRNALMNMMCQVDMGHLCPISMSGSVLPALRHTPELAEVWEPRILTRSYDPRLIAPEDKSSALLGMGMTERQGGSDVRANVSVAIPVDGGGPGGEYRLEGHKWFTSAPMCDAFLVLAHTAKGLSCFLLPRVLPDGTRNPMRFMRLKDKLGNTSNASGELEFDEASAWMVGEEGRGVPTIIDMVNGTRIDCTNWAAALMRQAVAQAGHHVANRDAFGATLIDKPLMQNVLADLELEVEAATLMVARISGAYDRAAIDPHEAAFIRIATAVGKYWVTKRSTPVVREALECVGGNGYVEESILPRLYREVPLNSIWEGSGNVIALDVLRAIARSPQSLDAFMAEIDLAAGAESVLDDEVERLRGVLANGVGDEAGARRVVEQMATCWAASLLVRHGDPRVAEAYVGSRLWGDWGSEFGTLPATLDLATIANRAVPSR